MRLWKYTWKNVSKMAVFQRYKRFFSVKTFYYRLRFDFTKFFNMFQVVNKGLTSYRDPGSAPGRGQKTLHITGDMDLTKVKNTLFFRQIDFSNNKS